MQTFTKKDYNGEECLIIPPGVTEIEDNALEYNYKVKEIVIPDSVLYIGNFAFANCKYLEKVTIGNNVREIGDCAFYCDENLREVELPESIEQMGKNVFAECNSLTKNVLHPNGKGVYALAVSDDWSVKIPDGVEVIHSGALFRYKRTIKSIEFPSTLKVIMPGAFTALKIEELTIGAGIDTICDNAFLKCTIGTLRALSGQTVLENGCFSGSDVSEDIDTAGKNDILEYLRIFRLEPVERIFFDKPPTPHIKDQMFTELAKRSVVGDTEAMLCLADLFERYHKRTDDLFYRSAANYWRYYSFTKGNDAAAEYFVRECGICNKRLPCVSILDSERDISNRTMIALGYLHFSDLPDNYKYYISRRSDENGVVILERYAGEEGPDSDGFGREELYDYWYTDEFFLFDDPNCRFNGYSRNDMRINKKWVDKAYEMAKNYILSAKLPPTIRRYLFE